MEISMNNKRVLIIGGTSGIGLALAKQVDDKGGHVIIASRTAKDKEKLLASSLDNYECHSVDITCETAINHLLDSIDNLDHIVITVKSPLIVEHFHDQSIENVRNAFETKFWGQYNFAKLAYHKINAGGSITFSSGTLGQRPYPGFSTMSIISGAVDSLCKALALELSPIRVNAVSPGFTKLEDLDEKIPLGLGESSQISNAYLFLMNDSYTTGMTLVSDGGALLV